MPLAVGRTVFVLGRHQHGNRQVVIYENNEEYDLSLATIQAYTNVPLTRFPYEMVA